MQISLIAVLATVASTPNLYECVGDYVGSIDQGLIHMMKQLDGLDEFIVSPERETISLDIAKKCPKETFQKLESLGVFGSENQLEVYAQATFLVTKYGGGMNQFIGYLADEISRWEMNSKLGPVPGNDSCGGNFELLSNRIQIWTPGQLIFRSFPVGICVSESSFWLHKENSGWRRLSPYETSEICTTLSLEVSQAYAHCILD